MGITLAYLAGKNWRELERACRDVLAIDPRNATALARLGAAQYWTANYADAIVTYRRLSDDYPSDLDYRTGLGWSLMKTGKSADAKAIFNAVLAVSPDNVSARQGLTTP